MAGNQTGRFWSTLSDPSVHWFSKSSEIAEADFKSARLDCYKYSFFIRIVSKWNDLPRDIVEAESLHHFKNKLHHYLFNKF